MRVLIADDNRLMLESVRRALEPVEDIEIVRVTHTGSQVLPLVERRRPDLVALEWGMRGADGRRCLELAADERRSECLCARRGRRHLTLSLDTHPAGQTFATVSSGTVTCAGKTATSFTGCTGGTAGTYPAGTMTVGRATAFGANSVTWSGQLVNVPTNSNWKYEWT